MTQSPPSAPPPHTITPGVKGSTHKFGGRPKNAVLTNLDKLCPVKEARHRRTRTVVLLVGDVQERRQIGDHQGPTGGKEKVITQRAQGIFVGSLGLILIRVIEEGSRGEVRFECALESPWVFVVGTQRAIQIPLGTEAPHPSPLQGGDSLQLRMPPRVASPGRTCPTSLRRPPRRRPLPVTVRVRALPAQGSSAHLLLPPIPSPSILPGVRPASPGHGTRSGFTATGVRALGGGGGQLRRPLGRSKHQLPCL